MSKTTGIPTHLGFPAPLLGQQNERLPILYKDEQLLAINKPAGILMTGNAWYRYNPNLEDAIAHQLNEEKGELLRLGLLQGQSVTPVYSIDPGISGVALFAVGDVAGAEYRNLYGSGAFTLRFHFLAKGEPDSDEVVCDLPLAKHFDQPELVVSHKTGKISKTTFRKLQSIGKYNLWEAETNYYRMEQLPVHAMEVGLQILGERKYAKQYPLKLSRLKRGYRGDTENEQPIYNYPAIHLVEVSLKGEGKDDLRIAAPMEKRLSNLVRLLKKHSSGRGRF
jgi:23S rRNA-/tRNA-specific pseudouridylate synthase